MDEFKVSEKTPFIVVLDNVRSLNNIGSIFRTSDALLIEAIYLCGFTATPPHKDIHKTALGATESVDWKYFETTNDAISVLKKNNYLVASIEQAEDSISLVDFTIEPNKKYAFIFGHEVKGVAQDIVSMSDFCIEIPQFGTKHSFNISVSAGIVLWDLFKKFKNW
ncbi:MAG: RNA methyltransferase [Bacteroidales bacterium]|nr:RNA methyltransferase [Bacteroidales bacterium]MCF8458499.1 RNA methyltransferase [Bacteroidales bacterium]